MPYRRTENGRSNQRLRTRKDLLAAAAELLKRGRTPDMDDVAAEARVSRATAYRYFPSVEALLVEAPLDGSIPDAREIFAGDVSRDPAERIDKAEAVLHDLCYRNEAQLRMMLAATLERKTGTDVGRAGDGVPVRQNRRGELIRAALALIFGTESMIVFSDVLGLDQRTARQVKSWAARTLVCAALKESARS